VDVAVNDENVLPGSGRVWSGETKNVVFFGGVTVLADVEGEGTP
jgi:hypothetical protein